MDFIRHFKLLNIVTPYLPSKVELHILPFLLYSCHSAHSKNEMSKEVSYELTLIRLLSRFAGH
jgi:hypothetical protein